MAVVAFGGVGGASVGAAPVAVGASLQGAQQLAGGLSRRALGRTQLPDGERGAVGGEVPVGVGQGEPVGGSAQHLRSLGHRRLLLAGHKAAWRALFPAARLRGTLQLVSMERRTWLQGYKTTSTMSLTDYMQCWALASRQVAKLPV